MEALLIALAARLLLLHIEAPLELVVIHDQVLHLPLLLEGAIVVAVAAHLTVDEVPLEAIGVASHVDEVVS